MGQFVSQFAEPGDPEYAPPVQKAETPVGFHLPEDFTSLMLIPIYIPQFFFQLVNVTCGL